MKLFTPLATPRDGIPRQNTNYAFVAVTLSVAAIVLVLLVGEHDATQHNVVFESAMDVDVLTRDIAKTDAELISEFGGSSVDVTSPTDESSDSDFSKAAMHAFQSSMNSTVQSAIVAPEPSTKEDKQTKGPALSAEASQMVNQVSDDAVEAAVKNVTQRMETHPISTYGKELKDAAGQAFEESYVRTRVSTLMNDTAAAKLPASTFQQEKAPQPGDLPIPPPLKASGSGPILWEERLKWARGNCVKVRSKAEEKCKTARDGSKDGCGPGEVTDVKLCTERSEAAEQTCHTEHHQAFKTCNVLWSAAKAQPKPGQALEVKDQLFTQQELQINQAHIQCSAAFRMQQTQCADAHDKARVSCSKLSQRATDAAKPKEAYTQYKAMCMVATAGADASCKEGHDATSTSCDLMWGKAQAVATPELAAIMSAMGSEAMAKALDTCRDAHKTTTAACNALSASTYQTCSQGDPTVSFKDSTTETAACKKAAEEGQKKCGDKHTAAHEQCQTAYTQAQESSDARVAQMTAAATSSAQMVAAEAKEIGIGHDVAKRVVQLAAQEAMVAVGQGEQAGAVNKRHSASLKAAREVIRKKMHEVVAGVRKVWKLKVKGAIKKAVTKAALQARSKGLGSHAATRVTVKAGKAAAKRLEFLAKEAELQAGAKAMGPEVQKLVQSTQEKDRRRFEAMAEPYLARADQLMKHMDEAEAKVEAAQDKKEKAQEKKDIAAGKLRAKERAHKDFVKNADERVQQTTDAVAGAGDEVSKELEHIARQAEEAANDARNTEVAVSVHVPAQASTP